MKTIDFLVEVVAQRVSSEVNKKFDVKMDEMFDAYNQQLSELTKKAKEEPPITDPNDEYGIETHPEEGLHGNDEFEKDQNEPSTKEQFEEGENLQTLIDEMGDSQPSELIKNEGELTRQAVAQVKNEIIERLDRQQIRDTKKEVDRKEEQEKKVKQKEEKDEKRRKKDKKDLDKKLSSMAKNTGKRSKLLVALGIGAIILWWRPIWSIMETAFEKILGKDWKEKAEDVVATTAPGVFNAAKTTHRMFHNFLAPFRDAGDMLEGSSMAKNRLGLPSDEYFAALVGAAKEDWGESGVSPADAQAFVRAGMTQEGATFVKNYSKGQLFDGNRKQFVDPVSGALVLANDHMVKVLYNTYLSNGVDMSRFASEDEYRQMGYEPEKYNRQYNNPEEEGYAEFRTSVLGNIYEEEYGRAQFVLEHDADLRNRFGGAQDENIRAYMRAQDTGMPAEKDYEYNRPGSEYLDDEYRRLQQESEDYRTVRQYMKGELPIPQTLTPAQQKIYERMINAPTMNISNIMIGNRQPSHTE